MSLLTIEQFKELSCDCLQNSRVNISFKYIHGAIEDIPLDTRINATQPPRIKTFNNQLIYVLHGSLSYFLDDEEDTTDKLFIYFNLQKSSMLKIEPKGSHPYGIIDLSEQIFDEIKIAGLNARYIEGTYNLFTMVATVY